MVNSSNQGNYWTPPTSRTRSLRTTRFARWARNTVLFVAPRHEGPDHSLFSPKAWGSAHWRLARSQRSQPRVAKVPHPMAKASWSSRKAPADFCTSPTTFDYGRWCFTSSCICIGRIFPLHASQRLLVQVLLGVGDLSDPWLLRGLGTTTSPTRPTGCLTCSQAAASARAELVKQIQSPHARLMRLPRRHVLSYGSCS